MDDGAKAQVKEASNPHGKSEYAPLEQNSLAPGAKQPKPKSTASAGKRVLEGRGSLQQRSPDTKGLEEEDKSNTEMTFAQAFKGRTATRRDLCWQEVEEDGEFLG